MSTRMGKEVTKAFNAEKCDSNQLEMVQRKAVRFVKSDYSRKSSVTAMRQDLGCDTLLQRRDQSRLSMMYRIAH